MILITNSFSHNDKDKNDLSISQDLISIVPGIYELTDSESDNLIRYVIQLIDTTSRHFGPHGIIASISNGLKCQTAIGKVGQNYIQIILAVASTYPKFRDRSDRME